MQHPYGILDVFPVGTNPPKPIKTITKVTAGDTIVLRDTVLDFEGKPVSEERNILSFALKDQRFSDETIWTGGWRDGIMPVEGRPGMVTVKIPDEVSASLRRGSYMHSLLVTDRLGGSRKTRMIGNLLVEYEATSPHSDIPYKRGSDRSQSYQTVSTDPGCIRQISVDGTPYAPDSTGTVYIPSTGATGECILPCNGKNYKMQLKIVDGVPVSYWRETQAAPVPCRAVLDGVQYILRLVEIDGVLSSYWEKDSE